jgi:hypothetical protein
VTADERGRRRWTRGDKSRGERWPARGGREMMPAFVKDEMYVMGKR